MAEISFCLAQREADIAYRNGGAFGAEPFAENTLGFFYAISAREAASVSLKNASGRKTPRIP
ncbi:hypothetical protein [uncultured Rhodoblastus sp.]|uniref:hypothetical protein n=1 Tax=uncultured Rhodoblastus sp. TaxID=543037 RepID=UPI0025DEC68F|nr:hypothetical protein [uncultured Rhodoblastus sp.]